MNTHFACPKCSQSFSVAASHVGRQGRCPRCGTQVVVPPAAGEPQGEAVRATAMTSAPAAVAPPPTTMIGPYQVRGKLGQGAFGVVYRAHDPAMQRDVAIKMLNANALKSQKYLDRFLREARVVGQMLHGNIVPVYQLGQLGADHYIVSAFIPGRPLADAIPEKGMDPAAAVRLVVQLLEALAYAHERGVLHRDVKPANAMLDDKGTLYLMDFGLAGLLDQEGTRMTQDGTVMGTPAYMPPEQAKGDIHLMGPASDQYSAGIVLYELLTGRLPFEAPSMPALLYQVLEATPARPSDHRPGLDPTLEAFCLQALAKAPANRFPNCRAFADALKGWLNGDPQGAAPTGSAAPATVRARPVSHDTANVGRHSTVNTPTVGHATRSAATSPPPTVPIAPHAARPSWWIWVILGAVAVPLVIAATYFLLKRGSTKPEDEQDRIRRKINQSTQRGTEAPGFAAALPTLPQGDDSCCTSSSRQPHTAPGSAPSSRAPSWPHRPAPPSTAASRSAPRASGPSSSMWVAAVPLKPRC